MLTIAKIQEKSLRCQKNINVFREVAGFLREMVDFKTFPRFKEILCTLLPKKCLKILA